MGFLSSLRASIEDLVEALVEPGPLDITPAQVS